MKFDNNVTPDLIRGLSPSVSPWQSGHGLSPSFTRGGGVLAGAVILLLLAVPAHADKSLDQLPAITTPAGTDMFYCVQSSTDYRCSLTQIRGWNGVAITGGTINGTTFGATTPASGAFTSLNATTSALLGVAGTATHPLEVRLDGAGFQTIAAFENFQAAAADVGPKYVFEGVSDTIMASVQSGWNGAATTDAYLAWSTRSSGTVAERMRLTSAGNLGIGTTPVNKLDVEGAVAIGATYSGASTAPSNGLLVEGPVGIGTASPGANYKLHVSQGVTAANSYTVYAFNNSGDYTGQVGVYGIAQDISTTASSYTKYGGYFSTLIPTTTTTANTGILYGLVGNIYHQGSGTLTDAYGGRFMVGPYHSGDANTGTITNTYGVGVTVQKSTGATATNVYGAKINLGGYGSTNSYGLWITGINASATNPFGIYQDTASVKNYFESNTGFGTNAPTAKVDVNSDTIRLRTAKTPASAAAACNQGEIVWDTSYIYICTATNTWKRAAIATW